MCCRVFYGGKMLDDAVNITNTGAILLGKSIEIDGFAGREIRVITHFHSDHLLGLNRSKRKAKALVATEPTFKALEVLGFRIPDEKKIFMKYNRSLLLGDERITLIKTRHIFGSSQVHVEISSDKNTYLLGYTSDFKFPGTRIMRDLDILVIDATYGSPYMVRDFQDIDDIELAFVDVVLEAIQENHPIRILAYYGKMQEAMQILRKNGIQIPFIMNQRAYMLTKVAVRYGMRINDFHNLDCSQHYHITSEVEKHPDECDEIEEILRSKEYILFQHMNSRVPSTNNYIDIVLTGWQFDRAIKKINSYSRKKVIVALSDHADFKDTLRYVKEARPKQLVVDAKRAGESVAQVFAEYVESRLGIKSRVLPQNASRPIIED